MDDERYRLVRDGTIKTYDEWVQDHMQKYGDVSGIEIVRMNIDFMIREKWLVPITDNPNHQGNP